MYTGYVAYCCMFIMIFIDHFLAYMNIRRVYKKYTRVGDFDTPTHQPTSTYISTYVSLLATWVNLSLASSREGVCSTARELYVLYIYVLT